MTDRIPRIVRFITEDEIIDDILNQQHNGLNQQHNGLNQQHNSLSNTNPQYNGLNQQQHIEAEQQATPNIAQHFVAPFLIDLMASFPFRAAPPSEEIKHNHYSEVGIPCPESGPVQEAKPIVPRCLVCRTNMIQTVNFPCMHACFCLECAQPAVQHSKKCPQCRTEYLHISMLYLAYDDQ